MKKKFSYIFLIILIFGGLVVLFISIYKNSVINNLNEKQISTNTKWSQLYEASMERLYLMEKFSLILSESDSLKFIELIAENKDKRTKYKEGNSIDFVKLEFDLNEAFLYNLNKSKNEIPEIINSINEENDKINKLVTEYNNDVKDFNRYFSTFPNFIFAKQNGISKMKYFTIKYGLKNEDPIIESKKLPEWAKDKDTLVGNE